jgi:hypothetical protein
MPSLTDQDLQAEIQVNPRLGDEDLEGKLQKERYSSYAWSG